VKELGGDETPAVGFAMGLERIIALCSEELNEKKPDIYFIMMGGKASDAGLLLSEKIRSGVS